MATWEKSMKLVLKVQFLDVRFAIETELPFVPTDDDVTYLASGIKASIEAQLQDDITSYTLNGRLPK